MAASNRYSDSDEIRTDAVGEPGGDQVNQNAENTPIDLNEFIKPRSQSETAVKSNTAGTKQSEKQSKSKIEDIPSFIKYNDIDILILYAQNDYDSAKGLQEYIKKNIKYCLTPDLNNETPNVVLLDEVITKNPATRLDKAFLRTLYIFLYVTKEFCDNALNLFQSHSCLERALNSKDEVWAIIPVHSCTRQKRNYQLPMMLDSLRPLHFGHVTFDEDVKKLLWHKSNVILCKRAILSKERQNHIKKYSQVNNPVTTVKSDLQKPVKPSMPDPANKSNEKPHSSVSANDQDKHKIAGSKVQMMPQQLNQVSSSSNDVSIDCEGKGDSELQNAQLFHKGQNLYSTGATQNNSDSTAVVTPTVRHSSPDSSNVEASSEMDNTNVKELYNVSKKMCDSGYQTGTFSTGEFSEELSSRGSHAESNTRNRFKQDNLSSSMNRTSKIGVNNIPDEKRVNNADPNRSSRTGTSQNISNMPTPNYNIHLPSAVNVVIGSHGVMNIVPSINTQDTDDSSDDI